LHTIGLPDEEATMGAQSTKLTSERACDPPEPGRDEVWATIRGRKVHGVYSVADGWVEVIADNGMTSTTRCSGSSAFQMAERLLRELYRGTTVD
jgi:hypothetical protein